MVNDDLHLPGLRPPRGAPAPARRPAAQLLRPRGPQRADGPPGARSPARGGEQAWLTRPIARCSCASTRRARWCSASRPRPTATSAQLRLDRRRGARRAAARREGRARPTRTGSAPATASTRRRPAAPRRRSPAPAARSATRRGCSPAPRWRPTTSSGTTARSSARASCARSPTSRSTRMARGRCPRASRAGSTHRLSTGTRGMHTLGPQDGELIVHTGKGGAAAKAGHELTIEVTRWKGTIDHGVDDAHRRPALAARARGHRRHDRARRRRQGRDHADDRRGGHQGPPDRVPLHPRRAERLAPRGHRRPEPVRLQAARSTSRSTSTRTAGSPAARSSSRPTGR